MDYNLEKISEPSVTLPLDSSIHSTGVLDFILVRANSNSKLDPKFFCKLIKLTRNFFFLTGTRAEGSFSPSAFQDTSRTTHPSPVSHFYTISMVQKFRREVTVQLSKIASLLSIEGNNL